MLFCCPSHSVVSLTNSTVCLVLVPLKEMCPPFSPQATFKVFSIFGFFDHLLLWPPLFLSLLVFRELLESTAWWLLLVLEDSEAVFLQMLTPFHSISPPILVFQFFMGFRPSYSVPYCFYALFCIVLLLFSFLYTNLGIFYWLTFQVINPTFPDV